MEGPQATPVVIGDAVIAKPRPTAIIREDIRPPIPRIRAGSSSAIDGVGAAVHLSRAINVESAAFRNCVEAPYGNALLAINDVEATALMITGWQATGPFCSNGV